MKSREDVLCQALDECLNTMYEYSQPSFNLKQAIATANGESIDSEDNPLYKRHYLSNDNATEIINHYMSAYNIGSDFQENLECIRDYMENGFSEVYEPDELDNGNLRRTYRDNEKLSNIIGCDNYKTVDYYFDLCKKLYDRDMEKSKFRTSLYLGVMPSSDKESVVKYWKDNGVDIEIKDFDFWDKYYNEDETD